MTRPSRKNPCPRTELVCVFFLLAPFFSCWLLLLFFLFCQLGVGSVSLCEEKESGADVVS